MSTAWVLVRDRVADGLSRIVLVAGLGFTVLAIVLVPRGAIEAPGRAAALLGFGVLLAVGAIALVWRLNAVPRERSRPSSSQIVDVRWPLFVVMAAGAVAQAVVAYVLQPVQASDASTYLGLARLLAHGETYQTAGRYFGFWPPGLPFFLTPLVLAFETDFTVLLVGNLVLYAVTVIALYRLATALFDRRVALLASVFFTLWPTRLLLTTQASKEMLTLALVTIGLAVAVHLEPRHPVRRNVGLAILLGAALGLATLAQPGLTLLFATFPFAFWFVWRRFPLGQLALLAAVAVGSLALVIVPWMVRNHIASHGAFSGISTNGGSVFYRANNELATGAFTERGKVDLSDLPELEQNREGFRLGQAWIRDHPVEFVGLAGRKIAALLDNDEQGVYWAIERRGGLNDVDSKKALTDLERRIRDVAVLASDAFWTLLCAAVAVRCLRSLPSGSEERQRVAALLYPFLYCCAIFAIFESGARQHIFAVGALIALAASAIGSPRPRSARSLA